MFSQSLMNPIVLVLLASSAVVLSQGTTPKTDGTTTGAPAPNKSAASSTTKAPSPATSKSASPSTDKTGATKPKTDGSSNTKTIVCSTGWAPVGDSASKSSKLAAGAPKTNTPKTNTPSPSTGATGTSTTPKPRGLYRRAAEPGKGAGAAGAKAPALENHKSLCDTAKERYTCPTSKCKPASGKKIAEASGCKGAAKTAQCMAYRPGVKGGQISLDAHTPHPTGSDGWIECAAFHKVDPKAGRNQKVDTIACQKLTVSMQCTGCDLMDSTKVDKPAPRLHDPSTGKPNASAGGKSSGAGAAGDATKPKSAPGSKTNGTSTTPPTSSNATKSDPSGKPKPSGTASSPSSSTPKPSTAKTNQPIGSQSAKQGAARH